MTSCVKNLKRAASKARALEWLANDLGVRIQQTEATKEALREKAPRQRTVMDEARAQAFAEAKANGWRARDAMGWINGRARELAEERGHIPQRTARRAKSDLPTGRQALAAAPQVPKQPKAAKAPKAPKAPKPPKAPKAPKPPKTPKPPKPPKAKAPKPPKAKTPKRSRAKTVEPGFFQVAEPWQADIVLDEIISGRAFDEPVYGSVTSFQSGQSGPAPRRAAPGVKRLRSGEWGSGGPTRKRAPRTPPGSQRYRTRSRHFDA